MDNIKKHRNPRSRITASRKITTDLSPKEKYRERKGRGHRLNTRHTSYRALRKYRPVKRSVGWKCTLWTIFTNNKIYWNFYWTIWSATYNSSPCDGGQEHHCSYFENCSIQRKSDDGLHCSNNPRTQNLVPRWNWSLFPRTWHPSSRIKNTSKIPLSARKHTAKVTRPV